MGSLHTTQRTAEEIQSDCMEPMVRAFADNISLEACACNECTRIRDKWTAFNKQQKIYDSIRRIYPNYKGRTITVQPFEAYHG